MSSPLPGLGRSIKRREDLRLLTGAGRFADNRRAPGAAHVQFVRSPHPNARIRGFGLDAALAVPGAIAVLTGRDVAADGLGHIGALSEIKGKDGLRHREPNRAPIALDRARHVGEIVAMAVAETLDAAKDAAEALEIDWEPLPAVVAGDDALLPGAPLVHDDVPGNLMCDWERGDAAASDAAFARAAHVSRVSSRFNRIVANYLETRAAVAEFDAASGAVTLTASSQGAHVVQRMLCERVLKLPREALRVVTEDVGGGFGPKFNVYPEQALLAWAARRLGRSLRWTCERSEAYVSDVHARDLVAEAELALDAEGRFLAVRVRATANFGAYVSMFAPSIPTTGLAKTISGLYRIPAIRVDMKCAFSNTVPVDAFRGAGKPEAHFLLERLVDTAAAETGRDPVALRRLNMLRPSDLPYTTPAGYTYDSGDYGLLLDEALAAADAGGFAARRAASEARGRLRGFGVSCHLHGTGGIADEDARAIARPDGKVEARTGTQAQGQGHETVYAQIVAAALGLDPDQVEVRQGDTDRVARGGGTGGSSSTIISGTTLKRAADVLVQRARDLAAEALETAPADIAYRDGVFEVVGTDRRVGLFELAARAEARGRTLEGEAGFVDRIDSWPAGVMACEVEIDPRTGRIAVDRFVSTADVGVAVNPMLVDGQMHGGIVQGIGNALLEDAVYDRDTAQLLAGSMMDYAVPRADDVPSFEHRSVEIPSPHNSLGIKGVGELPTNGAPAAVANAALDALRPLGVRHLDMPLTAEKVWRAIRAARATA